MKFAAKYYAGVHPVGEEVDVFVDEHGKVNFINEHVNYACDWKDIKVSRQLGQTARSLVLPNGAKCESFAHQEINHLVKTFSKASPGRFVHALESRWRYVFIASIVVVGFTWGMIVYGIPAVAKQVAHALPVSVDERLTKGSLAILDEHILKPSTLDEATKVRLSKKFMTIVDQLEDHHNYQLLFRRGVGPNAFALPSGHIVLTDELVEMAEQDEEILAVLVHEIGHVIHKHGLRSVLQSSAVALLLTAVTGDIGSAGGFAAAMPIILLETNYSRKFEIEADRYALHYMQANNIDTTHFATILKKISGVGDENDKNTFTYLSTHPAVFERIQPFIENKTVSD